MKTLRLSILIISILLLFGGCSQEPLISDIARSERLADAISLAETGAKIFITTIGAGGVPHLMIAKRLTQTGKNSILVSEWDCPRTLYNLMNQDQTSSSSVSIVVCDEALDEGYQLLGNLKDKASENALDQAQAGSMMMVYINKALAFSEKPHSDVEE